MLKGKSFYDVIYNSMTILKNCFYALQYHDLRFIYKYPELPCECVNVRIDIMVYRDMLNEKLSRALNDLCLLSCRQTK